MTCNLRSESFSYAMNSYITHTNNDVLDNNTTLQIRGAHLSTFFHHDNLIGIYIFIVLLKYLVSLFFARSIVLY